MCAGFRLLGYLSDDRLGHALPGRAGAGLANETATVDRVGVAAADAYVSHFLCQPSPSTSAALPYAVGYWFSTGVGNVS